MKKRIGIAVVGLFVINFSFGQVAGDVYGEYCGYELTRTGTVSNSERGIMFDVEIEGTESVYISGFSVQLEPNYAGKVKIFQKSGSHFTFELNPSAWTLIDSAVIFTNTTGLTFIPIDPGQTLSVGTNMAYYIQLQEGSTHLEYSTGTQLGVVAASDGHVILKEGTAIGGDFYSKYFPRVLIGSVHYCINTTVSCNLLQLPLTGGTYNKGIFFDVSTGNQEVTIEQVFNSFYNSLNLQQHVKLYARSGSFVGHENASAGWSLLSESTIVSPLPNYPEEITGGIQFTIPPNSTYGLFIVSDGYYGINYTQSAGNVGDVLTTDGNLTIHVGTGADSEFSSSGNYIPNRNFNGVIDFCVDSTSTANVLSFDFEDVRIYPNPVENELFLDASGMVVESISITNLLGQVVLTERSDKVGDIIGLDVSSLPRGTYVLSISYPQGQRNHHFVKN